MIVQKNVQLSEVNVKAFERHYPTASLSWCLDLLLEKFVAAHNKTPAEYAEIAVRELKEEI
jgi:hypothetical protein